jgi:L-iditol 2-dehydrogenase
MHAEVLTGIMKFESQERDRPKPEVGEVLIRIQNIGICGSDIHYWEHGRIGDFVVEDDIVLGHESAGEVVEVGKGRHGSCSWDGCDDRTEHPLSAL